MNTKDNMNKITLKCELVYPSDNDEIVKHKEWLDYCIKVYNLKSLESTVNRKEIEVKEYGDNYIIIDLFSEVAIPKSPGKALILLSKLLINPPSEEIDDIDTPEFDPFFCNATFHKKLFTTTSLESDDLLEVSDAEVVKALIDYLVAPKSTMAESKKKAFQDIKTIVINSGLLKEDK